jgi:RNA polymerase sigma factor (sigma-70 family)
MPDKPESLRALIQRIKGGDADAGRELVERYGPHLLTVVRRRLDPRLRSKYDSEDFVQAVWASFFAYQPERLAEDPGKLIAFLVSMARNKVVDAIRQRLQTLKYNVNREHSLQGSVLPAGQEPAARQPTASQVAVAREEWDRLLDKLSAKERRVLDLLLEGHTQEEIARELEMSDRHVRRMIRTISLRLSA